MKDSGVEWIGEIPVDWNIAQLKQISTIQTGGTPEKNKQALYYSDSGTPWIKPNDLGCDFSIEKTTEFLTEEGKNVARVFPKNTVYVCCIGTLGKTGYSNIECSCNQQINAIVFNKCIYWKFGYYLTIAQESQYDLYGTGNVLKIINSSSQGRILCCFPQFFTQKKISAFLDRKCAQVDKLISNEEKQIERLKAYKQSIITEAVTKGLNPDVPMKDSGVEWIGEIAEHWEVSRIKNHFELRNERNFEALENVNLISLYTDLGVIQHCDITETTGNKAITADGYKKVYEKDIVVNIILCWMGAVGMSKYNGVTSPAYDVYKPIGDTFSEYFHYLFRTKRFNGECYRYGRGIMMMRWRTYSAEFRAISIPVPPIDEQKNIVAYLDQKCSQIDRLISLKQAKIDKLTQYKKSLIYEYVTGKKEM